jgi:hypothetical protein
VAVEKEAAGALIVENGPGHPATIPRRQVEDIWNCVRTKERTACAEKGGCIMFGWMDPNR